MPFDPIAPEPHSNAAEIAILDGTIALLSDRWGQGWAMTPESTYCMIGAFGVADGIEIAPWTTAIDRKRFSKAANRVLDLVDEFCGELIEDWNDAEERKHAEVLDLLRRAREKLIMEVCHAL